VFLDFSLQELGSVTVQDPNGRERTIQNKPANWQGTAAQAAQKGYQVELFGSPDITGEKGLPNPISKGAFENALKNSEVVIYVGHGKGDTSTSPFQQLGIQVGLGFYSSNGTGIAVGATITPTDLPAGPKPDTSASVVGNFSCDASRNGAAYFNLTGQNQVMVTVNSSWDGVTTANALEKATNAFVKTYVATQGNIQKAVDAANKAMEKFVNRDTGANDKDKVEAKGQ
jgi:hypothetical protein